MGSDIGFRVPNQPVRQYERAGTVPNSQVRTVSTGRCPAFLACGSGARGLSPTARMGFPGIVSASPAVPGVAFHYPGAVRSPV